MAKEKGPEFLPGGLASIRVGLEEIGAGQVEMMHAAFVRDNVRQLWSQELEYGSSMRAMRVAEDAIGPRRGESDWFLGMTDEFRKGIAIVDRKLQGRILEAISYITRTPISPKGNTVKALSGELKELWRYRIGDYRLVYRPDESKREVMLVAFTNRGDAYG